MLTDRPAADLARLVAYYATIAHPAARRIAQQIEAARRARMVVRGKLTAIEAARLQAGEDDERTKQRLAEDKQ